MHCIQFVLLSILISIVLLIALYSCHQHFHLKKVGYYSHELLSLKLHYKTLPNFKNYMLNQF